MSKMGIDTILTQLSSQNGTEKQIFTMPACRFIGRFTISIIVPQCDLSMAYYNLSIIRQGFENKTESFQTLLEALEYADSYCGIDSY